ncbi:hypothetical protein MWL44_23905 [Escherichia coli]|nr:hypothetical protein [Escherichia coli]
MRLKKSAGSGCKVAIAELMTALRRTFYIANARGLQLAGIAAQLMLR